MKKTQIDPHSLTHLRTRVIAKAMAVVTLGAGTAVGIATPGVQSTQDHAQIRAYAEAYIYGFPRVLMNLTEQATRKATGAPINQFVHMRRLPVPQDHGLISPNVDTLVSSAWLDVEHSPVVLHLPSSQGRYYLMTILDEWTQVIASPGSRATGNASGDFLIYGPEWRGQVPENMTGIRATTSKVWIVGRTSTTGSPVDLEKVHRFQDLISLKQLNSSNLNISKNLNYTPPTSVSEQVFKMDAISYFKYLPSVDDTHPAPALKEAAELAQKEIVQNAYHFNTMRNNWLYDLTLGSYGSTPSEYLHRACAAWVGIGANLARDAVFAYVGVDSNSQPLTGSNSYVIHFNKDQIPPVHALWSITLYNSQHHLIENPEHKYAIHSQESIIHNSDGSLDLYIQPTSPGSTKEANWLRVPQGKNFNLMMRLYWPKESLLAGEWIPAPVQKTLPIEINAMAAASQNSGSFGLQQWVDFQKK